MSSAPYEQIADEIREGNIDRGLWMEAFAASDGDEQTARAQYIKLRVRKLRGMGYRERREASPRRRHTLGSRPSGLWGFLLGVFADLWTAWLWAWTFAFAILTAVSGLCLATMLSLNLYDDGVLVWPCLALGCAFMTCFLFGRGVQCLAARPLSTLFYLVEILALGAAVWPVSHLMNPAVFRHIPRALSAELVFLAARFLGSGDPWANALIVAVFFLPVYGALVFVRQNQIR